MAGLTKLSNTLINNSGVDLVAYLVEQFARAIRKKEDDMFMTGSGSQQPSGLRTFKTGMGTAAQAGATIAFGDLVSIRHAIAAQYRPGAVWLMNDAIIQKVAKLVDLQSRPIFIRADELGNGSSLPNTTVGKLLGNLVFENPNIPTNIDPAANKSEIWFGDFKAGYYIFDAGTMEVALSTERYFEQDATAVRVIQYNDAKTVLPEAIAYGTGIV
jgi:HK97 family phage major capsid protein